MSETNINTTWQQNGQNNQNGQTQNQQTFVLPQKKQNLIIAIIVSIGFMWLINITLNYAQFDEMDLEIARKQENLNGLKAQTQELTILQTKLVELEKRSEQLEKDYKKLNKLIPEEKELPEILSYLYDAGLNRDLKLSHFSQSEKISRLGALKQLPINVSVLGTQDSIARYLDDFNRFKYVKRLLNIDSIKFSEEITPKYEDRGLFTAQIKFSAFLSDPKTLQMLETKLNSQNAANTTNAATTNSTTTN